MYRWWRAVIDLQIAKVTIAVFSERAINCRRAKSEKFSSFPVLVLWTPHYSLCVHQSFPVISSWSISNYYAAAMSISKRVLWGSVNLSWSFRLNSKWGNLSPKFLFRWTNGMWVIVTGNHIWVWTVLKSLTLNGYSKKGMSSRITTLFKFVRKATIICSNTSAGLSFIRIMILENIPQKMIRSFSFPWSESLFRSCS